MSTTRDRRVAAFEAADPALAASLQA
ncbi:MAG: hypothetical protein JWM40_594, partial [Frankiales bacterium]|nr:hypothetical protein [Frankiales bacterium]